MIQSHLERVATMFATEAPVQQTEENICKEKVKVLQYILPIEFESCLRSQYLEDDERREPNYTDYERMVCEFEMPVCAAVVVYIESVRLNSIPYILRSEKTLIALMSKTTVSFRRQLEADTPFRLIKDEQMLERIELTMRLKPSEALR